MKTETAPRDSAPFGRDCSSLAADLDTHVIGDVHTLLATVLADPAEIKRKIDATKNQIKEMTGQMKSLQLLYRAATATKREYKKREKKTTAPAAEPAL